MNLNAIEAAGLLFVAKELSDNATTIEADLGPVEVILVNDGIKLADEAFSKLPLGLGALVDAAFNGYASKYFTPAELSQFVGVGIAKAVAYLNALAAKLQAA